MPILPVGDVREGADWFVSRLGFDLAGMWDDGDGGVSFAIVQLGLITVGLAKSDRGGSGDDWAAYFYLEDIDAFTDQILGRGTEVLRGPEESFYGCREIEVADPSGNRMCFAQDMKPGEDGPGL